MAVRPYTTDPVTLAAAVATVGAAVPDLTTRVIKSATITNPTAGVIPATVYMVPAGGALAGAGNVMISARPIAPGESYPCPELISQGLNAGSTVQALGAGLVFKYTATDFV